MCWADGWAGTGLAPRGGPVGESGRCGWTGRCRESTCRNPAPAAEAASSIARLLCPQDGSQDRSRRPGPLPALLSSRGGSGRGGRNRGAGAGSPKGAHCEVRTLRGLPGCRGGAWTGRGRARGSEEAGAGAERLNGALSVGVGRANADEHSQVVGVCRENGEQSRSPLWPGSLWGIVRGPGGAGDRGGGRPGRCGAGAGGGGCAGAPGGGEPVFGRTGFPACPRTHGRPLVAPRRGPAGLGRVQLLGEGPPMQTNPQGGQAGRQDPGGTGCETKGGLRVAGTKYRTSETRANGSEEATCGTEGMCVR